LWQAAQLLVSFAVEANFGRLGLATAWHSVQQRVSPTTAGKDPASVAVAWATRRWPSNAVRQIGERCKLVNNSQPACCAGEAPGPDVPPGDTRAGSRSRPNVNIRPQPTSKQTAKPIPDEETPCLIVRRFTGGRRATLVPTFSSMAANRLPM